MPATGYRGQCSSAVLCCSSSQHRTLPLTPLDSCAVRAGDVKDSRVHFALSLCVLTTAKQNTCVLLRPLQNKSHFQSMWSMGLWWEHHAQMIPVQTADWTACAFPASRQGQHYIRPDVPPEGQAHDGPGAQNIEREVSTSQTLQPFLNKCSPHVWLLLPPPNYLLLQDTPE